VCEYTFITNSSEAWEVELAGVEVDDELESEPDIELDSELCVELDKQPDAKLIIPTAAIIAISDQTNKYCPFFIIETPSDFYYNSESFGLNLEQVVTWVK
jgi:hypothetical protein